MYNKEEKVFAFYMILVVVIRYIMLLRVIAEIIEYKYNVLRY